MRNGLVGLVGAALLAATLTINGCGGGGSGSSSTGGRPGSSGSSTGGAASGGSSSGGAGSGGAMSGGAGSGGSRASGGTTGTGGSRASGGTTGTGGQTTNCTNGSTCGGDLVGTWNVTSSCLALSGDMDVTLASLGCPTVPVNGSLQVTGTWTANSDGSYTDNTTTTGSVTFPLSASCLTISSVPVECTKIASIFTALGWKTATCSTDTGGECNCSATANQGGGIGVISPWAATSGTYTTSGSDLRIDDQVDYSYCVSGSTLTLTPKPTVLPVTGTVALQKGGTGAGGAGGGAGGAGGRGGSGGATTSSGGRTGSGGATTGSGGRTGSGGATTGTGGRTGSGGATTGTGGAATGGTTSAGGGTGSRPCDIYAAASNTCVAAHSTVRALLSSYSGSLYRVKRASDGTFKDIGVTADGFADSAAQDTFCSGTTCTITRLHDQSGHGNYVEAETSDAEDPTVRPQSGVTGHTAASATAESLNVGGHKVYSLYTKAGQAYWRDGSKSGMPLGSSPQGVYMVTSGTHYNAGCCYDYGNGETSRTYVAGPTMDAVNFSGSPAIWGSGAGNGPWVMADLEGGVFSGATTGNNPNNPSQTAKYVTAIEKNNGTTAFALRGGDATSGKLGTYYSGALPAGKNPMKKQGSIILGSGGDCCYSNTNASYGTFYEGAIVAGYPSDATDDAIQANIVAAKYGQ